MTDKPMDVERTLRELEERWQKLAFDSTFMDKVHHRPTAAGCQALTCADELKAVREALREPGTRTFEEWWAKIVDNGKSHVPKDLARTAWNAALSSKQEPPAPARCPHCKGTKESPMPLSGVGARCFDVFHDSAAPPAEGKQPKWGAEIAARAEHGELLPEHLGGAASFKSGGWTGTLAAPGAEAAPPTQIESLAAKFHEIYQVEAKRQNDVRHFDDYANLAENIKDYDRALARYVLNNFRAAAGESTELRAAVDWVLNDAAYKAPELIGPVCARWIERLQRAASQERSATEPAGKRGKRCT